MTHNKRAWHVVRGLSVLLSSFALMLAAVGTAAAQPVASGGTDDLRDAVTSRILLIEPGITPDELEDVVDEIIDGLEAADEADQDEVDDADEVEVDEADEVDDDDQDVDEDEDEDDSDEDEDEDEDSDDSDDDSDDESDDESEDESEDD